MSATQRDVKNRIGSVKNIQKITRAMEMVAAARLRRAEQRIEALRPYARAIRRMTRQAAEAAGSEISGLPILQEHESEDTVALLLLTGDRGLAGAFNSQIIRAGTARARELEDDGKEVRWYVSGKRGQSTLRFRGLELADSWAGFTDRPAYADAQAIAHRLTELYTEGEVDRVVVVFNHFVSPLVQRVTEQEVLPIAEDLFERDIERERQEAVLHGDFIYEPEPEGILARLVPVYLETELYRALLESAASEQGARMTAMRNASKNAGDLVDRLTLEMNRARQAEITQEILEVVAGADALST